MARGKGKRKRQEKLKCLVGSTAYFDAESKANCQRHGLEEAETGTDGGEITKGQSNVCLLWPFSG